jgi:outer membrane protein assembly factor BamE (lipoprotein component of BamABCDE complex)
MRRSILLIVLTLVISACATPKGERLSASEVVERLKLGITDQQQVREWMGAPDGVRVDTFGASRWNYRVSEAGGQFKRYKAGLDKWVLDPTKSFIDRNVLYPPLGGRAAKPEEGILSVNFGADGTVKEFALKKPGRR